MSNPTKPMKRVCEISIGACALVTLLAVMSACARGGGASANSAAAPNVTPAPPTAMPTSATDAVPCGAWSAADGSTGQPVANKYGAISDCELVGDSWVIATAGTPNQPGVIGVDSCHGVAACLNSQTDRTIAMWTFYPGPYAGGIRILGVQSPGVLIIDDGGHQMSFAIATGTYRS